MVLVVDDQSMVMEMLVELLEEAGLSTRGHTDPAAALAEVENGGFRPRLVITDFDMPGMTGVELFSRIRALVPETRGILISGRTDHAPPSMKFLPKPFDPDALLGIVRASLTDADRTAV